MALRLFRQNRSAVYTMPRKPSFHHPLRDVRTAAGLTQDQLARLLGVSRATILSIENGRLKMWNELALKVRAQTGCALTRKPGKDGRQHYEITNRSAQTLRRYTKDDFEEHRKVSTPYEEDLPEQIAAARRCCHLLLSAAARRRDGTLAAILHDFEHFAVKSFELYRLAPEFEGMLREDWLPCNKETLNIKTVVRNFPLAPLSTAYPFQLEDNSKSQRADRNSPATAAMARSRQKAGIKK